MSDESNETDRLGDLLALMPHAAALGVTLDAASADEVRGRMAWAPEKCTAGGALHGGVLMTFADSLGAACAFFNLPEGAQTTTLNSSTNFVRAVRDGEIVGIARPLHAGRTMIIVQTDVRDTDGRLIAQTTQTQAILAQPEPVR